MTANKKVCIERHPTKSPTNSLLSGITCPETSGCWESTGLLPSALSLVHHVIYWGHKSLCQAGSCTGLHGLGWKNHIYVVLRHLIICKSNNVQNYEMTVLLVQRNSGNQEKVCRNFLSCLPHFKEEFCIQTAYISMKLLFICGSKIICFWKIFEFIDQCQLY